MRTKVLNHFHTFHPEATEELDRLLAEERRLTRAKAAQGDEEPAPRRRMSEPPEDIDAALEDVRAKMEEQRAVISSGIVRVIVKGLTRGEFRRLIVKHPPRDDDPLDAQVGYNSDTFGDEFIQACILRCETLDGETVECQWDKWADEMTNGQWEEFFTHCLKLTNDGAPSFPR